MSIRGAKQKILDRLDGTCIWQKTLEAKGVLYICSCNPNLAVFKTDYAEHNRCPNCHKLIQWVGLNGKVIK